MTSLFLLLPISLLLVVIIGVAFWWAIFSGQFDNTQQAAESILHDDDSGSRPEDRVPARKVAAHTSGHEKLKA